MTLRGICMLLGLLLLGGGPSMLMADVTATVLGVVKDTSNAVVPGVKITVTHQQTNRTQSVTSGADGQYRLMALPVGIYRLDASSPGFQRFVVTDLELNVNDQRRVDVTLQVGNVQTEVLVEAASVAVETSSSQLGEVISERKIMALPLNGRSFMDLLGLQAGVVPVSSGSISGTNVSGGLSAGNVSVNGQRESTNAFMVNGADVSEGRSMGASVIPNLDSVAEFRLITNSFDAEYGRFSGAIMNAVTKTGTNGFHGSAFEFLRNDRMDSRGFFDPTKPDLKRNQFGFSAGGPMIKNKVFWFTDYQGTREVRGISTGIIAVPTVAQRGGDLSAMTAFMKGGSTVNGSYWAQVLSQRLGYEVREGEPYTSATCTTAAQCVFPGGIIPAKAFSPAAMGTLKFIPAPNSGAAGYATATQNRRTVDDKIGERIDVNTQRLGTIYGYYHFDDSSVINPLQGSNFGGFSGSQPTRAQLIVLGNTKLFGPTTVNESRISFTRMANINNIPTSGFAKIGELGFVANKGLGIYPSYPAYEGVPRISLTNFNFGTGGGRIQANNTWHASDTLSKVVGKHTLKMGGEFRYLQINERNVTAHNGQFSFDGSETGSDWADYLLGAPSGYTQASLQLLDSRSHYGGAYAQDSWRATPNLTVNLGLRWEVSQFWYDTQDKIQTIVRGQQSQIFPNAPKGWVFPGDPGIPRTLAPTGWTHFSPRIGIAYSPSVNEGFLGKLFGGPGKTSIRAGTGRYFTAVEDATMFTVIADAPFGLYWLALAPPMFEEPFRTRADGTSQTQRFPYVLPTPGNPATKNIDFSVFLPIASSPGVHTKATLPYAMHFNFTIQRALSQSTTLTMAYVGTQGRKLPIFHESNPGDPGLCLSLRGSGVAPGTIQCGPNGEDQIYTRPDGSKVYSTRPNFSDVVVNGQPAFGGRNPYIMTAGNSSYHSGQISVEHRAADMTFMAAYTRGKAIDNSSSFNEYIHFMNYRLSRALSLFDVANNFVFSYGYALPFNRLAPGAPKALTTGWSINGITRFASGFPVRISQSGDRSLYGTSGIDTPNFVGPLEIQDPRLGGPTRANMYFNKSAFTSQELGKLGTANRHFFHGPGLNNFDFSVHKDTQLRESLTLQIRAEFFNVFNHAQFNNPNGSYTSSTFGYVTSARDPRIGQVSAKVLW